MATGEYRGVDGVARKIIKEYRGVEGIARKVTAAYRGVNGVARKFYSSVTPTTVSIYFSGYSDGRCAVTVNNVLIGSYDASIGAIVINCNIGDVIKLYMSRGSMFIDAQGKWDFRYEGDYLTDWDGTVKGTDCLLYANLLPSD